MFTGIVTETGKVEAVKSIDGGRRLVVAAGDVLTDLAVGDSIALNGVCLTAVTVSPSAFEVEAVTETLDRSNLGSLASGDMVNLERPVLATGRLDGHVVQGHVDGVGVVADVAVEGEARRFRVTVEPGLLRYIVEKGSIAVDGTSLTVTAVGDATFEFVLIPHTLGVTVLGERTIGDEVNVEVDILAKYVERMMGALR
jgi:riboflavin synthase